MALREFPTRLLNYLRPLVLLLLSAYFGLFTALSLLPKAHLHTVKSFREQWFARFWLFWAPISDRNDSPFTQPMTSQARGVVLDLGPGSGSTIKYLDKSKLTHVYGVEPNLSLHPRLRQAVRDNGLSDVYTVLACGAQDMRALRDAGIVEGSVDTILSLKVLCSLPEPAAPTFRDLYRLIAPGGQWLVFEHVGNRRSLVTGLLQGAYQFFWPYMLAGCNINRPTDKLLIAAGDWKTTKDLRMVEGEKRWEIIPHILGRLEKAG